ncbi:MAG: PIN domain-containing protein [Elusimicrobia bacterium]|nr:PIN domain-containing protein [Elusimicrobiota bacterium]
MNRFFDTSVLVATFWGDHPHHEASLKAFVSVSKSTGACAAHSLAEVYAVLTRLPVRPVVTPADAFLFIEEIKKRLTVIVLDERAYTDTLHRAVGTHWTGGMIYDALILKAAEQTKAKSILTWNIGQFRRIAPSLANRIRTP